MKLILSVLLLSVTLVLGSPAADKSDKGWLIPQLDGSFRWMTLAEAQAEASQFAPEDRAEAVFYYLYTRANRDDPQLIDPSNVQSLKNSHFNSKIPTRIIVHGWQNDFESDVNRILLKSYLDSGDYNVIVVDWSKYAITPNYPWATMRVAGVGKKLGKFVDFLNQKGSMAFGTLHLVGYSLGAHVAGVAGKRVKRGRINTIIGLDPAYPLYTYESESDRLTSDDAIYVESIQTCGGLWGFLEPIGKATFYPNGGQYQPGCGLDASGGCAHGRSIEYYGESIARNSFVSMSCSDYTYAINKDCGRQYSAAKLGSPTNVGTAAGAFYTPVNKSPPFAQG